MRKFIIIVLSLLIATYSFAFADNIHHSIKNKIYFILGISPGSGIVDNDEIDFITGATKVGFKTGGSCELNIAKSRHHLETGLTINYQPQTISYNDSGSGFIGKRKMKLVILHLPISYNLHLFHDEYNKPLLITKLISYFTYIPFDGVADEGNVPDYTLEKFSREIAFSITFFPFYSNWGVNFEGSRGVAKLYQDKYHRFSEQAVGGYSGVAWSIQYRFE